MTEAFDISPEKRASTLHFFYRQLLVTPPPVSPRDADLKGKTAIVTGANGGLGPEIAKQLLDLGCKVILAVRDEAKGQDVRRTLGEEDRTEVWALDLSSRDSILAFAERAHGLLALDIAILNAGVFKVHESFDPASGYEESVQINYLSTVLVALLLLPIIKARKRGREPGKLVLVSSDTAAWARFTEAKQEGPLLPAFKQPMQDWDMAERYGTTKLLGQLFVTELARRVDAAAVTVSCANPGFCRGSDLGRQTRGMGWLVYKMQCFLLGRSCRVGARSIVHAAATLGVRAHGQYVEDGKVQPMPPIVYSRAGPRLAKLLYEETLDELAFAGLGGIVQGL
ncbi:NAD(P)-binding protein [Xylaria sp. CBS 124048]|nr:NAD(P)-binding protein [Xylaria sp. CBS 124048]